MYFGSKTSKSSRTLVTVLFHARASDNSSTACWLRWFQPRSMLRRASPVRRGPAHLYCKVKLNQPVERLTCTVSVRFDSSTSPLV